MDQELCTAPTAFPRCSLRITSAAKTEPAAHSPPKPRPCRLRATKSQAKPAESPWIKVKPANQAIVIRNINTRPYRSARIPVSHPPTAENSNVQVASNPASAGVNFHNEIKVGMTKL